MTQRTSEKISALDQLTAVTNAAEVPVIQGGTTWRVPKQSLLGVLNVRDYGALPTNSGAVNDVAITAAVAACVAATATLWWPDGTYPSAASIPLLHTVRHRGPGRILRGSDTFYVEPGSSQTNRLYLSPTGGSGNDGLTASQPMATPQNAFDALKNYGPMLEGTWRVECVAGTWNGTVHRHQHTTPSKNPVIVAGPSVGGHPNVPTAIFDGTSGALADDWAIAALGSGVQIELRDLKAQNYVGLSDSNGFYAGFGASFYWSNIHVSGCSFAAVYLQGCTTVRGSGGIWGNTGGNSHGAYVNGCNDTTIGASGAPVRINGSNVGIEWARGSQGHVDYCEFNDCAYALDVYHTARVHALSNNFKRSTVTAIRLMSGGELTGYESNAFNNGGVDANAVNILSYVNSGRAENDGWLCQGLRRRAYDQNSYDHTGTTSVTTISTLLTGTSPSCLDAYWFRDNTKKCIVKVWGRWTTSALSAISVSLGGTELNRITLTSLPTAGSHYYFECTIEARGTAQQQVKQTLVTDGQTPKLTLQNSTVSNAVDLSVAVNLKLANAADHAEIYWTEAWLVG